MPCSTLRCGKEYRLKRFLAFLNPWEDPAVGLANYPSALRSGTAGLLGPYRLLATKWFYLPEPHTDFIFAVLGRRWGSSGPALWPPIFHGSVAGIPRAWPRPTGTPACLRRDDHPYLPSGCVNIGVVTGSLPITGIPLPFISSGGSALLTNMAAAGVLLNISSTAAAR